jgi:CRP-like cAMP-binding protein
MIARGRAPARPLSKAATMATTDSTHVAARDLLLAGEFEQALRMAGPMLEANPEDLTAWRLCATAMLGLGHTEAALKNLGSVAMALAESQSPFFALAVVQELAELGGKVADLIHKIAVMYGAGSPRLVEMPAAPPPLPPTRPVPAWDASVSLDVAVSRANEAMVMAWGAAMAFAGQNTRLPYVPLLSALAPDDLVPLLHVFKREVAEPGKVIVEQGRPGDAMYIIIEGSVAVILHPPRGGSVELAQLGPGAFFGEMALVSRATRAAEVRTVDRTVVLVASKEDMEQLAAQVPDIGNVLVAFCHARMLENLMRISPVLAPVPAARRPEVVARFGTDFREAGTAIIEEGREGPGLFLVVSGLVRVTRKDGGEDVIVADLGPGELFGEISLLMRKPSTASVTAIEDTALLFLPREDFHAAIGEHPELLKGAYDIASRREDQNYSIMASSTAAADDLVLV